MRTIDPVKSGLALGALLGLCHLGWVILVAVGWAQPLMDFMFWLHFIKPVYVIDSFNLMRAIMLVAMTTATGFVMGFVFGLLWNWFHK